MSVKTILNSLEKSWQRDEILIKIKNGIGTDEIINEFLKKNEVQIKELNTLLRPEDINLLNQVEQLSSCESKLVNKLTNSNYIERKENNPPINHKKVFLSNRFPANKIILFINNWSNRFVVITLLTISAIALSKQAWA